MTRRSINLIQFWLAIGLFSIPAVAFAPAGYIRFKSGYFPQVELDVYPYVGFTLLVTLLWAFIVGRLGLNKLTTLLMLHTGIRIAATATAYCTALALSLAFFYRTANFARVFIVIGCSLTFAFSFGLIHIFRWVHTIEHSANGRFPVAILGADHFAEGVAQRLLSNRLARCKVACFVALPGQVAPDTSSPVLQ